ncbi:MAG TPA: alcohol dehydrogenase catalytic domain-containing protein, partial [Kineosporiaceae bacterium]|nr:alcohol dehydrogenase catalytic domain-containing protein [Kineosporiaceae bacterium]
MKALRKLRAEDTHLELVDVEPPVAAPGWAVLDVTYAGICGTDVHITHNRFPSYPPVTLGHEFLGVVTAAGDGVAVRPGTRVVCEPHALACGVCHLCRRGHAELCAAKRSPGWGIDGAMAEQVAVPAHLLHPVPDGVSDLAAALTEPTAIVVSGYERAPVPIGGVVLVVGPGPIGILAALVARAAGAGRVVLCGRPSSAARLELAASLGIETVLDDGSASVADTVREATGGRGADLVVETSGSAGGIATCVEASRRRGRMLVLGVPDGAAVEVPWGVAMNRALDVAFSLSSSWSSWDAALALMARGAVDPAPLATVLPLRGWEDAFAALAR